MQLLVAVQTQHLCLYLCCFLSLLVNLSYLLFPGIEDLVHHSDTTVDQPGPDQTFLSSGPDQSLPSSVSGSSYSAGCERKDFYSENQINFYSEVFLHLLFNKVKQHLFPFQGQCLHPQRTLKLSETRKVISHQHKCNPKGFKLYISSTVDVSMLFLFFLNLNLKKDTLSGT